MLLVYLWSVVGTVSSTHGTKNLLVGIKLGNSFNRLIGRNARLLDLNGANFNVAQEIGQRVT